MTIKAVVFDIGNVLIEWNPERVYDAVIGPAERERLFERISLHKMNDAIDRGAPFQETVYETAEQYPEDSALVRLWHDRWADMASPEITGSVVLLRALRAKGVPVFVLSNIGVETYDIACKRYPFLREFDQFFISGAMEVIKPEPAIYAGVEKESGIAPESLLFADDRADNIAAAAARGWATHLFTGPSGWAQTLVDHGVLTAQEAAL